MLLGVDGWESVAGLGDWPTAVNFRADIVQSVIASLRQKNFDGLDLKWEFPTARRVRPIGKDAYTTLLQVTCKEIIKISFKPNKHLDTSD